MEGHTYHWRHGWIPLDRTAALSKMKGNHKAANEYPLTAIPSKDLHRSSHVVAADNGKGHVVLSDTKTKQAVKVRGSVAATLHDQGHTITGVHGGLVHTHSDYGTNHSFDPQTGAQHTGSGISAVGKASPMSAADVKVGDVVQSPGLGGKVHRLKVTKAYPTRSDGSRNVDVTNLATGKTSEMTLQGDGKMHTVER